MSATEECGCDWCGMPVLPRRDLFGRQKCYCYINTAKLVAGVGSAPTSADFQPAAHLSEPSSVYIEWSFRVVTLHGLPVIDRLLCC